MKLTFASWNVKWISRSRDSHAAKVAFLFDQAWDVVALQEVTESLLNLLRDSEQVDGVAAPGDIDGDRFGSVLLSRNGVALNQVSLLPDLPRPRLGIAAMAMRGGAELQVASWHAQNAAKEENHLVKRASYVAFERWCGSRRAPLIVGTDANHASCFTREEDFPGSSFLPYADDAWSEENRFWTQEDPDMRDAWIQYLTDQPKILEQVRAGWTSGPSAVSYRRGSAKNPVLDRRDYILVSPEFRIESVAYDYEGGREAGSDHAYLTADLELEMDGQPREVSK